MTNKAESYILFRASYASYRLAAATKFWIRNGGLFMTNRTQPSQAPKTMSKLLAFSSKIGSGQQDLLLHALVVHVLVMLQPRTPGPYARDTRKGLGHHPDLVPVPSYAQVSSICKPSYTSEEIVST